MSLADDLKKDGYVLFTTKQFWGALIAVLAATGFTAWGAAKAMVESSAAKVVMDEINALRDQAKALVADIQATHGEVHRLADEIRKIRDTTHRPFSVSGTCADDGRIEAPYGSTNDWSILVGPIDVGDPEKEPETNDNALLRIHCTATADQTAKYWTVSSNSYSRRSSDKPAQGGTTPSTVNYLLVHRQ